jgi:hydrogenase-4 component F
LLAAASQKQFDPSLVRLAFVFILVGYGTKVGFVPMHSWLPDAHAEAPTPVSAMLSAILLNCAMYALIRYEILASRAIGTEFAHTLLLFFGTFSIVVAGLLILVQRNFKRMLAYSSVEHMGIIAIGVGLGGPLGLLGALLHTFNHSTAKALLFFGAGNVRHHFGTLRMDRVRGMARSNPRTAGVLIVGGLAIVGLPPFSLFVSEFAILSEAFTQSRYLIGGVFLTVLSLVFGGFLYHLLRMICGASQETQPKPQFARAEFAVMVVAGVCLLYFGVHIPAAFSVLLHEAMTVLQ